MKQYEDEIAKVTPLVLGDLPTNRREAFATQQREWRRMVLDKCTDELCASAAYGTYLAELKAVPSKPGSKAYYVVTSERRRVAIDGLRDGLKFAGLPETILSCDRIIEMVGGAKDVAWGAICEYEKANFRVMLCADAMVGKAAISNSHAETGEDLATFTANECFPGG